MVNLDDLEDLLRKGKKEKAYELVKEDKGITAEILINEGIYFETIGEHNLSISYLEFAERFTDNGEIKVMARKNLAVSHNNRGLAYCELEQHEEAIEDYNEAIAFDPNDAAAYINRGSTYFQLKKHEKAIEDYNKAIALNPSEVRAYINRGTTYCELEQHEKAIEDYNKAIALNPNFAAIYSNRGIAYSELKKYKEAIEDHNKAIELNPNIAEFYLNRGTAFVQANEDLDKAIGDFKHARDLFEGKDKEEMLGVVEWAKARKEMNMKRIGVILENA